MRVVDSAADEHLGPACPSCGWRRGQHRPQIGDLMPACDLTGPVSSSDGTDQ